MRALFDKEMTRKEFLQLIAGSFVILFGAANFLKMLNEYTKPAAQPPENVASTKVSNGFGARKFGA